MPGRRGHDVLALLRFGVARAPVDASRSGPREPFFNAMASTITTETIQGIVNELFELWSNMFTCVSQHAQLVF
jgi:hypothetical protein